MKKIISSLAVASALATSASAIPLVDGGVGVGVWAMNKPTGNIDLKIPGIIDPAYNLDLAANSGFPASNATYVFAYLDHPVPIIPNVRLEYVEPEFTGTIGEPVTISAPGVGSITGEATNTLNMQQIDAAFYYDLFGYLPTSLIPFVDLRCDFGFGGKAINGTYVATVSAGGKSASTGNLPVKLLLPYAYINPRVEAFGFGFDLQYKYLSGELIGYKSGMEELSVSVDYRLGIIPFVDPGIEVGYKMQNITLDSSDLSSLVDTKGSSFGVKTGFEGFYAGVIVDF